MRTLLTRLRLYTFLLVGLTFADTARADSRNSRKIDDALVKALRSGTTTSQSVIIRTQSGQTGALTDRLRARGNTIDRDHAAINAVSAHVSAADLALLAADPDVLSISINGPVSGFAAPNTAPVTTAIDTVRATLGLSATSPTGKGI